MELGGRIIVEDVERSPIFLGTPALEIQRKAGVRGIQSTPLVSRSGNQIGIFSTHYRMPKRPDTRTIRLLDLLARKAADIIESEQTREALKQLNESLEQQVAERAQIAEERAKKLQIMVGELTIAEQKERQNLAKILHDDLQQLLVGAKMNSEILLNGIGGKQRQIVENILDLINQSIQTSRSLTAELSPPALEQGFSSALRWLSQRMPEMHGLNVELKTDPGIDMLREDVTIFLYQSLRELLLNVVKHSGTNSASIEVTLQDQNYLRLSISDHGHGFDPASVWKMEEKKYGLISIRERLELMGGSLEVESSPGNGATLSMMIPFETIKEEEQYITPKIITKIQKAKTFQDNIKVLVVDDHIVVRQGIVALLNLHFDIEVVGEAGDGEVAVEKAWELQPDVILMDIRMPKIDGVTATRIISSELSHIRIIGLSMSEDQDQADQMMQAGAFAYCAKDGNSDNLLHAIRGRAK